MTNGKQRWLVALPAALPPRAPALSNLLFAKAGHRRQVRALPVVLQQGVRRNSRALPAPK